MLLELEVNNIAVIEELHLSMSPGLNILTGETGAGKSILIDAIGLVLGERASFHYLRTGAEQASVTALFQLPDEPYVLKAFREFGVQIDDGRQLVLCRELNATGKSTCRINGRLSTVSMLRSLGQLLVDIHGQHEHQSLLHPKNHISYLDNYGGPELVKLRELVEDRYKTYRSLQKQLNALKEKARERAQKLDLYSFQAQEIASAGLEVGEEEELLARRDVLKHREKLLQLTQDSYQALYGNEPIGGSVLDQLGQIVDWLEQAAAVDDHFKGMAKDLESMSYQIEEITRDLRAYRDTLDLNPDTLMEVEDRLYAIGELKRKYGDNIKEILQYQAWAEKEVEKLQESTASRMELVEKQEKIKIELAEYAQTLSKERHKLAAKLEDEVRAELAYLGMEKTVFIVSISQQEADDGILLDGKKMAVGNNGIDRIEFLLAPNPGEEPKPLSRIASGGELSRIMLALKSILASVDTIPTMIFDEIDAGIGGRSAQAVAERLATLSKIRQVLCVTHLPQIAAMADSHWRIAKEVEKGRTFTKLTPLGPADQVEELARMLGGARVTGTTKEHSREMLSLADKYKRAR
ncbi:MAG: DNA repair protein RecN [Firmicutes bacterium]|nr:DNA repair protein RecN [Bacillota bacterium]